MVSATQQLRPCRADRGHIRLPAKELAVHTLDEVPQRWGLEKCQCRVHQWCTPHWQSAAQLYILPKMPSWRSKIQPVPSDISGTYSSCTLGTLRSISLSFFHIFPLWRMPRCHVVNELGKMAHQGQIDRLMRHPGLDQTIGCLRTPPRPFRHRKTAVEWPEWHR